MPSDRQTVQSTQLRGVPTVDLHDMNADPDTAPMFVLAGGSGHATNPSGDGSEGRLSSDQRTRRRSGGYGLTRVPEDCEHGAFLWIVVRGRGVITVVVVVVVIVVVVVALSVLVETNLHHPGPLQLFPRPSQNQ